MADVTQTPANVLASDSASTGVATCGSVALDAGQPIYLDASDLDTKGVGKAKKADADLSASAAFAVGVTLHPTNPGQPVMYANGDSAFTVGGTLVKGKRYVVSRTAGKIMPDDDLLAGDFRTDLGPAISTTQLALSVVPTGIQL